MHDVTRQRLADVWSSSVNLFQWERCLWSHPFVVMVSYLTQCPHPITTGATKTYMHKWARQKGTPVLTTFLAPSFRLPRTAYTKPPLPDGLKWCSFVRTFCDDLPASTIFDSWTCANVTTRDVRLSQVCTKMTNMILLKIRF